MAVTWLRTGSLSYAAADTVTPTIPTHATDDLLVAVFGNREDSPVPAITTPPSGWTQIGTVHNYDAGQTGIGICVFYKKAASASETDPTLVWNTGAARGTFGVVHVFEGQDLTSPMDAVAAVGSAVADSTTLTPGAVETQTDGSLVVSIVTQDDNTTLSLNTANSFTLHAQEQTSSGADWTHGIATKTQATAGTVTMLVWGGGNDAWAYESFAIKPGTVAVELNCESGSFSVSGAASPATLLAGRALAGGAEPGAIALTGADTTLARGLPLNAEPTAFDVSGPDVTVLADRALDGGAEAGSHAVTGSDATTVAGRALAGGAEAGSHSLTGAAATLLQGRALDGGAVAGSFAYTGADATLEYLGAKELDCEPGSFSVSGPEAIVIAGRALAGGAEAGAVSLTGAPLTTLADRSLNAESGSLALTGAALTTLADRSLAGGAVQGSYDLTGADTTLTYAGGVEMNAEPGSFALTGAPATLDYAGGAVGDYRQSYGTMSLGMKLGL